ncbi:hypothetical protein GYMLUDRAFT_47935 [Collybiopsis luxurians FD-317 M1]|uniref:Translation initiation factor IF-3 n=1 Tax=Collybiopsis luxurians FD-317 M1 TaxID=944289 RepID=A0A0D0AXN3_9AGAR|nr:hypothetical protein GYMLUDRAFT_47935 [Collybiopsis luxurians FD-317 M1]
MATFLAFRSAAKRICASQKLRVHTSAALPPTSTRRLHVSTPNQSRYHKPRDEKIPFAEVHLADRDNDGKLVKTPLKDLLAKINHKTTYIELQVSEPLPIVQIVDREEAAERKKLAKERQKQSAKKNVKKEFQFTWGMAVGDMEHRLGRVRAELRKGARVDLVFAPKGGQRAPPVNEMREKMRGIAEKVADVGVEWKASELQRGIGAIFVQGKGEQQQEEEEED